GRCYRWTDVELRGSSSGHSAPDFSGSWLLRSMEVAGIYERDCFALHPGNTYEDAYRHLADGSMTKLGISEHEKAIDISIYVDAPFLQHYQQHQPPLSHELLFPDYSTEDAKAT
ncbi:hypothetical protein MHYP_G00325240, partial [Metynnis hypsauchen]